MAFQLDAQPLLEQFERAQHVQRDADGQPDPGGGFVGTGHDFDLPGIGWKPRDQPQPLELDAPPASAHRDRAIAQQVTNGVLLDVAQHAMLRLVRKQIGRIADLTMVGQRQHRHLRAHSLDVCLERALVAFRTGPTHRQLDTGNLFSVGFLRSAGNVQACPSIEHLRAAVSMPLSFARAAMARTTGRVWFQERHGVIPIAEAREWESFASSKHAVCN